MDNKELCQIDVERALLVVMNDFFKYLNAKDLCNVGSVCRSWRDATLREKEKRRYVQRFRFCYSVDNWTNMLQVVPFVSLMICDSFTECPIQLPRNIKFSDFSFSPGYYNNQILGSLKQQLPNNSIIFKTTQYFTTGSKATGKILGHFIPNIEQRIRVQVAWIDHKDPAVLNGINNRDELADRLAKELGLDNCKYPKSTIVLLTTPESSKSYYTIIHELGKRAKQNGKEITFASLFTHTIMASNRKDETCGSNVKSLVALRISGPNVESCGTFIHYLAKAKEYASKLLELKEKVKRKRHNIGLFYVPMWMNGNEIMLHLRRIFPHIQFTGVCEEGASHYRFPSRDPDLLDEDDLFNMNFLLSLPLFVSVIIISYD